MNIAILFDVFIAGGIGACIRASLIRYNFKTKFPFGTLFANLIGCTFFFLFALFFGVNVDSINAGLRVGLCGGISTLSTAALEILKMAQIKDWKLCFQYCACTIAIPAVLGILSVFAL